MSLTNKQVELVNLLKETLPTAPPEVAQNNVEWFKPWVEKEVVAKGDRRWELVNDAKLLYECIAPSGLDAGTNLYKPSETPAIWKRVWLEEYPEWVKPLGAHDAYAKDAKVTHKGKKWTSDVDNNVWEPGEYGWTEVTE